LKTIKETLWREYDPKSYIFKTVGVQALFDVLKRMLQCDLPIGENNFETYLDTARIYDFSSSAVQASGIGRKDIRNAILLAMGIIDEDILNESDLKKINEFKI